MTLRFRLLASAACTTAAFLMYSTAAQASFVANFHNNLIGGNNTLFIFGTDGTTGTVTGNDGFNQNFSIDATGVYELSLGVRGREMTGNTSTPNNLSLLVDSADPISGLALNRGSASTDMTTLLDVDALSTEYRILTISNNDGGSQMSVTATEDNTTVTIDSPVSLGGNAANTPFQVVLNAGESVFYETANSVDLTGTHVTADKNVAVFGGNECTDVPASLGACDHVIQQQFGVENFDTDFLIPVTPFAGDGLDLVRVIASADNTEVFINGVSQGIINEGEFLEVDNVGNARITATEPVSVGQFMRGVTGTRTTGDPAFALIPSVDQLLDAYAFSTPVGGDSFAENQLNIAIAQGDAASLTLNGLAVDTSGFTLLDGILYGSVAIPIGSGVVEADNPFLATISGFANADSYLTPIASAFSPGVSPPPPDDPPVDPPVNPVPLPVSAFLLLGGLGILGSAGRWKRKQS